jgi:hypothetical protein
VDELNSFILEGITMLEFESYTNTSLTLSAFKVQRGISDAWLEGNTCPDCLGQESLPVNNWDAL